MDLAFRKTIRDGGKSVKVFIDEIKQNSEEDLNSYFEALNGATDEMLLAANAKNFDLVGAMSTPYLNGFALIAGAVMMERMSGALSDRNDEFAKEKKQLIEFYKHNILPQAHGHLHAAIEGAKSVY